MGYLQARTNKLVTSARPLIIGHLEPDETVQAMAIGLEGRHPMRRVLIVGGFLIVVNVFLAVQGFELKSWVIGASLGVTAVTAYIGQARWIVLTDRRVMFLSAHPFHQRPTRFLGSHPRNAVRVSSEVQTSWGLRKILWDPTATRSHGVSRVSGMKRSNGSGTGSATISRCRHPVENMPLVRWRLAPGV